LYAVPPPTGEHNVFNDYDILLCALSLVLDRFEKEDQSFAAQCIWWLASIIHFTEILIYYRHDKIFPSDYVKDLVVTQPTYQSILEEIVPESDISELDLCEEICIDSLRNSYIEHLLRKKFLSEEPRKHPSNITTRSGKVFKPQRVQQKTLAKRDPGNTDKQLQNIRHSLREDGLILYP